MLALRVLLDVTPGQGLVSLEDVIELDGDAAESSFSSA
jgi:hypothetical protein